MLGSSSRQYPGSPPSLLNKADLAVLVPFLDALLPGIQSSQSDVVGLSSKWLDCPQMPTEENSGGYNYGPQKIIASGHFQF